MKLYKVELRRSQGAQEADQGSPNKPNALNLGSEQRPGVQRTLARRAQGAKTQGIPLTFFDFVNPATSIANDTNKNDGLNGFAAIGDGL